MTEQRAYLGQPYAKEQECESIITQLRNILNNSTAGSSGSGHGSKRRALGTRDGLNGHAWR